MVNARNPALRQRGESIRTLLFFFFWLDVHRAKAAGGGDRLEKEGARLCRLLMPFARSVARTRTLTLPDAHK